MAKASEVHNSIHEMYKQTAFMIWVELKDLLDSRFNEPLKKSFFKDILEMSYFYLKRVQNLFFKKAKNVI